VIFVHFTGFAELLDEWGEDRADQVAVILSRYYGIMQRVIASNGGVLTRSDPYQLGSKLLITFGAPVAHPDDPDRAVTTALEMNRQLRLFNSRLKEEMPDDIDRHPFIFQRMGITQGDAFAGEVGWRQRREYTVMGDDVNLAARLMAKAQFGQIIISQNIWDRVNPYFKTEALEPFAAKGKSEPIQAYTVQDAARGPEARTSDTPFIGREVTQHVLNLALQEAGHGHRDLQVAALTGDIGVGKTRLAKQFAQAARSSGFEVAWATCRTQSTRKTTWATLIASLLGLSFTAERESQLALLKEHLAELELSDLGDVLTDLIFDTPDVTKTRNSKEQTHADSDTRAELFKKLSSERTLAMNKDEMAQFRKRMKKALGTSGKSQVTFWDELQMGTSLSETLITFLKVYTREMPTLIVIDDLHKENPRALNILKRMTSELQNARLMILVAYEPSQDIDLGGQYFAVPDLTAEETYLMTATMLDASELGPRLSHFIWESTSGRALYTESLIQAIKEGDQIEEDQGIVELKPGADVDTLPRNVRGLVISRVDRLSSDAREVLRVGAVFGESFTQPEISFASHIQNEHVVANTLADLTDLQILEDQENGDYRFKHGVMQQALYEELTRQQRQDIHQKIADYFAQQEDSDQQILNHIFHLIKAGHQAQAVTLVLASAQQAEAHNDIDQALELYTRALELLPDESHIKEELERLQGLQEE
jgi:class 3 adenylate cyclase/predicted ATPase